jgi:A/G-specific adenine glycosylase
MGYNKRAVRLLELARRVRRLPTSTDELMKLPGIGRYTAHAVACFAFGKSVPVVDTNIQRVLRRLFRGKGKGDVWNVAWRILPKKYAYEWNQGLMELGALICTPRTPRCDKCPVQRYCPSAFRTDAPLSRKALTEPGRYGIPNRIYRGRVVEVLRSLNGKKSISSTAVARQISPRFLKKDRTWFTVLLTGLERDGLIQMKKHGNKFLLSLPTS